MEKWHPGHITEAKRKLIDNLKMCDTVVEVIDARSPFASKNRELDKIIRGKKRVLIINKIDLIEEKIAQQLEKHFKGKYRYVIAISAKDGKNMKRLFQTLSYIFKQKKEKQARKNMRAFPIRVLVLGMPNVGKSRIINALTGRKIAGVADRAGFTRGKQWIKILPDVELLDTPGILWTNSSEGELKKIALIGCLKDSFHNLNGALEHLVEIIGEKAIYNAYELEKENTLLEDVSKRFGLIEEDAVLKIVKDFRAAKLGKISLESA